MDHCEFCGGYDTCCTECCDGACEICDQECYADKWKRFDAAAAANASLPEKIPTLLLEAMNRIEEAFNYTEKK